MTDLTTPAASPIALPVKVAPPSVNPPATQGPVAFCEVIFGKTFKLGVKGDGERQDDAATGKALPDKGKDVDPALAWLFGAPTVLAPIPAPAPAPSPVTTGDAPVTLEVAPNTAPVAPEATEVKPEATEAQGKCEVVFNKPGMFQLPVATPGDQPDTAPQPIKLPLVPPRLPADPGISPPSAAAAALPAIFALSMTTERGKTEDDPMSSPTPGITPLSQVATAMPVAPTSDVQRQTLDMGRQDWPQKMIDHIEALRDNANANDTSIRLKPEALGRVDIALKTHDNGAISVRFTAEQPTTRTLLVDATPQLSAAAEARGIRLSGTSVDLSGQGDQRPQPQTDRAQPITNRLATPRGDDNRAADDGRIA